MTAQRTTGDEIAVVPVRAGSKGLPGKNLMLLDGVPLYLHAVQQGLRTVGRVLLSTDIAEIHEADLPEGCILCRRPLHLAADDTPMASVIHHLIVERSLQGGTIVLLQATSPLRSDQDIQRAMTVFQEGGHDMVLSVVERDRGVLKYGTLENNTFTALREQAFCFYNRQQLPPVFGPNGAVYVFEVNRFLEANGFPSERIGAIDMPADRSADIDNLDDLRRVQRMLQMQNSIIEG
ncbi:cytidylyltransferase domain-containing protein [Pseudooceanicola sp. MF1-13]|uniref:acylneuraminate cytidylyltransferase family protein n=1 Tax=Pseudooceanicola sp. MF1-13 TaxID=3379095 RepID=UPI00389134B7